MDEKIKRCRVSGREFVVTDADQVFYQKIGVPEPTLCPDERLRRRLAFRNERFLYKRKCDLCERAIISFFPADVEFPVYCNDCWWGDGWNAFDYGREFDFSRSFFEQYSELLRRVPKMGMLHLSNENSEYNSLLAYSKNTYMGPGSYLMEDCYYVRKSRNCRDCVDGNFLDGCELVSDSFNSMKCYRSDHLINCRNCADCSFMADCFGCRDCFMCSGVSNQKFSFKNKAYSEEEYRKIVAEYRGKDESLLLREFLEFNQTIPKKYQNQVNCENSSGDYIQNCKGAEYCFDSFEVEDSKYVVESIGLKDSMDVTVHDMNVELCYELCTGGDSNFNVKFSFCPMSSCVDSSYLYSCIGAQDCLGCDAIRSKKKFCVLNKQYSEAEYRELLPRIVEHMQKMGEWGEFFPVSISLYPYNHTLAQDWFPLTKEEVLSRGYQWKDDDPKQFQPATCEVPSNIEEVSDDILNEILACRECGKNYRLIAQELKLRKTLGKNLSKFCPDCRQQHFLLMKNPRRLWERNCDRCGIGISTTYAPDRPERVYCEKCYLGRGE